MKLSTQMVASAGFVMGRMMRKITEEAKKLLRQNLKMYAVAKLVGYGEERHFSATFKKWTGLTPSQYQKGLGK